jgi:MFS family permease
VTLPPVWLLIVNTPADMGLVPDGRPQPAAEGDTTGPLSVPLTVVEILHRTDFWFVALAVGVLFATYTALLSNLAPYAVGQGLTGAAAATLISTVAMTGMAGTVLFGLVADRVDLRLALAAAMILECVALALFRHAAFAWELRVASGTLGVAAGAAFPIWGTILGQAFGPLNYGRVMGLMDPLMITPLILVSSPVAGRIFDVTGNYRTVFDMFLGALLLAGLLLTRLQPIRKHDPKTPRRVGVSD